MSEGTPIDIKDPMIQAHFGDFSGDHDKGHLAVAEAAVERHRELFYSLKIHNTPRPSEHPDGSIRITVWRWDRLTPKEQNKLEGELGYPMDVETVGLYSPSST
jgi:hypothetical protein